MDWEYIKRNGYAAWQVIPLFFTTYFGMALVFGGSAQIAWQWYQEHHGRLRNSTHAEHIQYWEESLALLISGVCVLSVAIVCSIVVCLIVPMMKKRRQRRQHVHAPEPEEVELEAVQQSWVPHSSTSDIHEASEVFDSSPTAQLG